MSDDPEEWRKFIHELTMERFGPVPRRPPSATGASPITPEQAYRNRRILLGLDDGDGFDEVVGGDDDEQATQTGE